MSSPSPPESKSADRHLVSFFNSNSFEAEQYRRLRQRIEELGVSIKTQVLAITSAVAGDGKTLTAANLAGALAHRKGARILLIDSDLRHPSVANLLGMKCRRGGIAAALDRREPLSAFVEPFEGRSVSLLLCEKSCPSPYELLSSPRFGQLLTEARAHYDYVIVDTPPLVPVPDATLLRHAVDGYLVVVAAGRTPRKLLGEALNLLPPESVLGLVFNHDEQPLFGYYSRYCRSYFGSYIESLDEQRVTRGARR
jgi:capsular exopolysaccharide synthesis family protein